MNKEIVINSKTDSTNLETLCSCSYGKKHTSKTSVINGKQHGSKLICICLPANTIGKPRGNTADHLKKQVLEQTWNACYIIA